MEALRSKAQSREEAELTRAEYLRLLQTAKRLGRERLYLLVKVFATVGLPVQHLPELTVEAARQGAMRLDGRELRLPEGLRRELLDYAQREHIRGGPVFVTRNDAPLDRSNVTRAIAQLCREAGVPERKGSPRCLRRLCRSTQDDIRAQMDRLARQTYDHLLETEQITAGWK